MEKPTLQRYAAYKDSGVEWLGAIPEHWELTRLGTRFLERRTKVSDKDFEPLSVTKNGVFPQLASAAKSNDGDNRKLVKKGDFVINSRSDRKASSGISDRDGSVSLIYIVIEPININSTYCNYLLRGYNFVEEFYRMGHGIVADLWTTRYDEMKSIMVGIPTLQEQTAIANFLDDKTTKIDQAVAIKQKQIELLKERRQILIHKAVTRGLNDNVRLKDSGVEWIGEIPEHWEVNKLKNTGKLINGATPSSAILNFWDGDITWVTPTDINNIFIIENSERSISKAGYKSCGTTMVPKGSLILTTRAPIGKIVIAGKELCTNQGCKSLVLNKDLINVYLYYQLSICSNILNSLGTGTTFMELSNKALKNFLLVIPPKEEQTEIAEFIEAATTKIATAISLKEQEIEKLKEYKMSLIDAVVTGKVKVC